VESFSFLYLNPPYDAEIGSMGNKRMEYLFLEHTFRWLVEGGVLLMVVPQERLESTISLLAGNFTDLQVYRLTDPEAQRFGVRKRMRLGNPSEETVSGPDTIEGWSNFTPRYCVNQPRMIVIRDLDV
jgi:hypothetical protein